MNNEIIETNKVEDIQSVINGLDEFNESIVGKDNHKALNLIIKDESGKIIAGLIGGTYWGWLYVDRLWVDKSYRKKGIGKSLLEKAENEAKRRGCLNAHLDTMSFQALEFYKKQGYIVKCEIEDIPRGYSKYHLIKQLE
jgi:GNAT superfamily N-acetyltransferase